MFHFEYVVGPLMGGVIGYITNALAIRMLFRPYEPKYLLGHRLPFTPGIIPKEKGRLASSLGMAISENLMSGEVLEKYLLSDAMVAKVTAALDDYVARLQTNTEPLREYALHFLTPAECERAIASIKQELTLQVGRRLADSSLGTRIADVAVDHIASKMRVDGLGLNIGELLGSVIGNRLGGFAGNLMGAAFGSTLFGKIADFIQAPLKSLLAKNINAMLRDKGADMAGDILTNEIDKVADTPVHTLLEGHAEQLAQLKESVVGLYRKVITGQLPRILATIDIPSIIEGRINEMDMRETEALIFKVMDKELKAIIWLGALLGLMMGTVNAFI